MKWDGIRGLGVWDGERLRLRSRNGNDLTAAYPELTAVDLHLGPSPPCSTARSWPSTTRDDRASRSCRSA